MKKAGFVIVILLLFALLLVIPRLNGPRSDDLNDTVESANESRTDGEIIIGIEYVIEGMGEGLRDLGIDAVKPLPDSFSWDKMQGDPDADVDFTITDEYVKEYQGEGFSHMVLGLKVAGGDLLKTAWMVDERYGKSQAVAPDYMSLYYEWVRSIVERYDMDGVEDMPGLRYPVMHYEIGVEFSSYQPEPTEVYLETLELGYTAAHNASDDVMVGHSAFLLTPVFRDDPGPGEYEEAFDRYSVGTAGKDLEDIRMVLDRPDIFDVVNVHNLGWPYEIERIVRWVQYEMKSRGYQKPILISDTVPTSFAGFGPATRCEGDNLAVLLPPAREEDRCRLAEYFKRLVSGDREHIEWLHKFLASDIAQRVVIAAEQGIALIDTAFAGDIPGANLALFQAAAGNSGWSGILDYSPKLGGGLAIKGKRLAYFSLQQVQERILGYEAITRLDGDDGLRLYRVDKPNESLYVAWYGYQGLYLPGDPTPKGVYQIDLGVDSVVIEKMCTSSSIERIPRETNAGVLELELTPEPTYILLDDAP